MPTARKTPLFSDTTPEAEDFLLEGYRRMSPAEKFRRVTDLNATLEALAAARIRRTYGSSSPLVSSASASPHSTSTAT